MEHGPELTIVLVACIALGVGAGVKLASKNTRVPYSVAMLLLGMLTGAGINALEHLGHLPHALAGMASDAPLSPDMIMFVFLPTLVFESALSLKTHAFARNIGPIATLAIPALLACTVATAFMMVGLTGISWQWALPIALVFGALISATDPVAVVALLRDVGAPKRLSLLIEGESLLNDATAIVLFGLLIPFAAGATGGIEVGSSLLDFLRVLFGGIGVGLGVAMILSWMLNRIFNEPVVEIMLTIVVAYFAMILAEAFLHVSGVIALVTLGLYMAGPGRTATSPEVRHHQHRFFEMLAFIANTLIFFLAGVVIISQFQQISALGVLIVIAAWVAIMAIRFAVTFLFRPLMNVLGPKVTARQALVMSWGGLRGAVSLALALIVVGNEALDPGVRGEILRATAGVVLLTILFNGMTTGWLLKKLGFAERPVGERLMRLAAQAMLLRDVEREIDRLSARPDYRTFNWSSVRRRLVERLRRVEEELRINRNEVRNDQPQQLESLGWYQAIAAERSEYRRANEAGMIAGTTLQILEFEIDNQLERLHSGKGIDPDSRSGRAMELRRKVFSLLRRLPFGTQLAYRDLSLIYELAWVEYQAAGRVLSVLEELAEKESENVAKVIKAYRRFKQHAQERLEDLRTNAPEVARAIEERLATRAELNYERRTLTHLEHRGIVPEASSVELLESIEKRMAKLAFAPVRGKLPEIDELLRSTPLFKGVEDSLHKKLVEAAEEVVFSPGDKLMKEGDPGDSMFIIARGAARVVKGEGDDAILLDVLGGGELVGEMALLTGDTRTASVVAGTTLTAARIPFKDVRKLMDESEEFHKQMIDAFARHVFDNALRSDPGWQHLRHRERLDWIDGAGKEVLKEGEELKAQDSHWIFLLSGTLKLYEGECHAPRMLRAEDADGLTALKECRIARLGQPPARPVQSPTMILQAAKSGK